MPTGADSLVTATEGDHPRRAARSDRGRVRRTQRGVMTGTRAVFAAVAALAVISGAAVAGAQPGGDTLVTVGSPATPFSQNKQNEPAVAIDPSNTNIAVAGANEEIDMESCTAGA